jgi:hypothetical protein
VAPSRVYWAGRPAMRLVQALYWLQDLLQSDPNAITTRVTAVLNDPRNGAAIRNDLLQGIHTLPIWMQAIVRPLVQRGKAPIRKVPTRSGRATA